MSSPALSYLDQAANTIERARQQLPLIEQAADWCAETILAGRMVHLFGSGHSRILVEEMWPRYGSFPGFNPIVELSLTFHNLVVGANGQRQAMFLENVSGLANRILRNFGLSSIDTAIVISSSGTNVVPVEIAEQFQAAGIRVIALVSSDHAAASISKRDDGKRLADFADLVLDTGAPAGDACVTIPGVVGKVAPLSTIGGCAVINALKAEIAQRLSDAGQPPLALAATNQVGAEKAAEIFEAAYDEHGRRLARLLARE
ncbi:MAG: SIS domain-containing protein [Verrucomicrobiae bacterium]|nr:SIS domain-containing protein [Verrucomicrobiae bacterium]